MIATRKLFQHNLEWATRTVLLSVSLILLSDCSWRSNGSATAKPPAVPVKAAKVVTKEMPIEISSIGNVEPVLSVAVKPQVSGRLIKVNFREGDFVNKGQLLFEIDSRVFVQSLHSAEAALAQSNASYKVAQANLANALAQLSNAKSNVLNQQAGVSSAEGNLNSLKAQSDDALSYYKSQQSLFASGVIAQRDLEVAETSYKSALAKYQQALAQVNQAKVIEQSASSSGIEQAKAVVQQMQSQIQVAKAQIDQNEAAVENARIQLSYCRITSPIDGKTGELKITKGNLVSANDSNPIVTINSISPIYVTFSVPEKYLTEIQRYFSARIIRVSAHLDSGTNLPGTLSSIDNEVNQTTGTAQLKASFENEGNVLFPGRFVNVVLTLTNESGAIVVPSGALQIGQQGQFVYVVKEDGTAEFRKITLDRTIGDDAVVSEGLNEGETVITDGQLRVSPGATVQIVADASSGAAGNSNLPVAPNGGAR